MSDRKLSECEMVQDLLPLYQDDVCSEASKKIVEDHLKDCRECSEVAKRLKNTDVDNRLVNEKKSVLGTHAKKERKRSATIGICTAGILMIPVIVCLICNLAIGHALDWFFIVLASLLVVASITVVPMIIRENTLLWTLGSFVFTLVLLFLVLCIYTKGNWFLLATVPTIFGLSVIFMPYVVSRIPLPDVLANKKGILVMLWDTVWLFAIIIACGFYSTYETYWRIALQITAFCSILPWLIFICIRYFKLHPYTKAGIITILAGCYTAFTNDVIGWILDGSFKIEMFQANLLYWDLNHLDANLRMITMVIFSIFGCALIVVGQKRKSK